MTVADRRAFIEKVRKQNERDFRGGARQAVQKLLSAGLTYPWTYVYELTQNAIDAGARRVAWQVSGDDVRFQHDGHVVLDESDVRGMASLGASTKGLASVGFMGVGFKSVFARFLRARVSGCEWGFMFDVGTRRGDLDSAVTEWFDTLRPFWDEGALSPDGGYTTAIRLERPATPDRSAAEDLERLASPDDPTPLGVLALRGLEEVRVGGVTWDLAVDDGVVVVRCSADESIWRWKSFVSRYRPDDDAMRRLLEVRQETHDHVGDDGQRVEREVVGLLPLDDEGLPKPMDHGRVYATLPTQVPVPFGFHVQADWLVDVDRQSLRDVKGDPWQEAIVQQVPEIVRQLLVWLTATSDEARKQGYRALRDPWTDDGILSKSFQALQDDFVRRLADQSVVPIQGAGPRRFRTPDGVARLPGKFLVGFGRRPQWRPELLFGCDLMDEDLLGDNHTRFAHWLAWGSEIEADTLPWPSTLPEWWNALPEDERTDALFALWHGVGEHNWDDAPVVPTEAGEWVPARNTRWLNEEPPTENNPGGEDIARVLEGFLPRAYERVPSSIRARANNPNHPGIRWLRRRNQNVEMASLIRRVFGDNEAKADLPLVALLEWALSRGEGRRDLVPLVLTEQGARKPEDALLADPLVEGGRSRRRLFPDKHALVEDYASLDDRHAVVLFLERLGVFGGRLLDVKATRIGHSPDQVAMRIGIDERQVERANHSGYTVLDYEFPLQVKSAPPEALQDWLSHEHEELRGKGRLSVSSKRPYSRDHHRPRVTQGRKPATWVRALQEHPWLLCTDSHRRTPGDVLLEPDPDFEEAPIADVDAELADRLTAEGIRFGSNVPKSPVLRRLARASDMPDGELAALLQEAREQVEGGEATRNELLRALDDVQLRRVPLLSRVVERSGAGGRLRSDLSGWVVALSDVEQSLAAAVRDLQLVISETTTGRHALDFLYDIWERRPERVDSIRANVAAAYRYVLDDIDRGELGRAEWRQARDHVHLYGQDGWFPIANGVVVDDVQSPLIRQLLPKGKSVVASHLGDTSDEIRRVTKALELGLLSDEVGVSRGLRADDPACMERIKTLVETLAMLEGRRELREVAFHDLIFLRVDGTRHSVRAYVDDGALLLVGEPSDFAAEAAGQLVEYFRLGQRGNEIPYLTAALYALDDARAFSRNLEVLAGGLGVTIPEGTPEPEPDDLPTRPDGPDPIAQPSDVDATEPDEPERDLPDHNLDNNDRHVRPPVGDKDVPLEVPVDPAPVKPLPRTPDHDSPGAKRPDTDSVSPGRRAADHFGLFVKYVPSDEPESVNTRGGRAGPKDDHTARRAVIEYERGQGRQAEAMPDLQPGFDVRSVDPSTGNRRRIEAKGVQGIFTDDASVVLTARQVRDALETVEDGVEYWLYVVDSTETAFPRVFPIPWTRYRTHLKYGFYAHGWAGAAEQPDDGT